MRKHSVVSTHLRFTRNKQMQLPLRLLQNFSLTAFHFFHVRSFYIFSLFLDQCFNDLFCQWIYMYTMKCLKYFEGHCSRHWCVSVRVIEMFTDFAGGKKIVQVRRTFFLIEYFSNSLDSISNLIIFFSLFVLFGFFLWLDG